ncbi:MAG: nucleotide exchange factor GrpE [Thermodesulfobacteriota bacterium]
MQTDFSRRIADCRRWLQGMMRERLVRPVQRYFSIQHTPPSETVSNEESGWKEKALADFGTWLETLPEIPPPGEDSGPDSADLLTLLSEFTALRQEVRLQNREQNKGVLALNRFIEDFQKTEATLDSLGDKNRRMAEAITALAGEFEKVEDRIRNAVENRDDVRQAQWKQDIEKSAVRPFLDVRDSLVRGLKAAREASGSGGFFRASPKNIEGVIEGYSMALRRFDRALAGVGIRPVEAMGKPFDPKIMRAVDTRPGPEEQKGIVVEEQLGGFIRGDEVIRTAEVVVVS